ncbi:corrinoid ABC transporter substrate-binding protein [Planctomycetes bacterium Pla163]|uniref:Corrinoid ABC transporter substrate-binding protein n=1 Tax=Rohdeia mirabilis TaxID=2528008 RepID=A0A518D4Z1_9BACT|nr:corrinoid ABC transporter substrate-binding protein [Planctomycetes bacterium Pla163]
MKTDLLNGGLLVFALVLASWFATLPSAGVGPTAERSDVPTAPAIGATEVVDARGVAVPIARYERIVSINTVADALLLELVERERIAAVTDYMAKSHTDAWRFGGIAYVEDSQQIERILAFQPDLVLTNPYAPEPFVARLRESGLAVFDLGDMRGAATTLVQVRTLGALVDERERADRLAARIERELAALEAAVPADERVPGVYLAVFGDSVLGGTTGTNYADVLYYGGVRDLAAEAGFTAWPSYEPEQLVAMDPPLIVTSVGQAKAIRSHSILSGLSACGPNGRIVEIDETLLGDPGLGVIEAARRVLAAVHGR